VCILQFSVMAIEVYHNACSDVTVANRAYADIAFFTQDDFK
jgi:hypothetical protein